MLEEVMFFETVRTAAASLRMVEQVDACDDPLMVKLQILDFLPGGPREPWVVEVKRTESFVHPFFGERYACIELSLAFMIIHPDVPGYLDRVAVHAASCLDHQRFCFGASSHWNPDTGQLAIYGQLRLWDQPQSTLIAELHARLRDVIALTYLISFRIWQLQLRRQMPETMSTPVIEETHNQMLDLLGAAPPVS